VLKLLWLYSLLYSTLHLGIL